MAAARARRGEPWRREAAAAPRAAAGATHAAGISTIVRGASVLAVSRRREVRRRPFPCVVGTRERRKALGRAVRSARGERGARSSASIRKEPPSQSNRAMEKDLACLESQILNLVSQFLRETAETGASQTRYFESLRRAFFFARDRRMQHFERHPPVACHDEDRGSAIDDEEAARGNAYAHQGTSGTRSRASETDRARRSPRSIARRRLTFQDAFPRMRDRRARSRAARSPRAPSEDHTLTNRRATFLSV